MIRIDLNPWLQALRLPALPALLLFAGLMAAEPAAAGDVVTLRNLSEQSFLQAEGGQPVLAADANGAAWELEKIGSEGEVRLRHAGGGYLNVEYDARYPAVCAAGPSWWSAIWILESAPGTDFVRIRNKWRKTYLRIEDGRVEVGEIGTNRQDTLWRMAQATLPGGTDPRPTPPRVVSIPAAGNAFFNRSGKDGGVVDMDGIGGWESPGAFPTVYVRPTRPGRHELWLIAQTPAPAVLEVEIEGQKRRAKVEGHGWVRVPVGTFALREGYVPIAIRGIERSASRFPDIRAVEIDGERADFRFIDGTLRDTESASFLFGRRGPQPSLEYVFPKDTDIEWFYSEITVPKGNDVLGSFFMADGSAESYFGFQVNGENRRLVLFSVWSPFKTDDPKQVPAEQRVIPLAGGPHAVVNQFGGEGSGGQAYLVFPWKAGLSYGFLKRIHPNGDGTTDFSTWFHDPERDQWHFLATFRRPISDAKWYDYPHSFLENFYPDQGGKTRMALYGNQWARDTGGSWHEITSARFKTNENGRIDFQSGVKGGVFFLRAYGFFDDFSPSEKTLIRRSTGKGPPDTDLKALVGDRPS